MSDTRIRPHQRRPASASRRRLLTTLPAAIAATTGAAAIAQQQRAEETLRVDKTMLDVAEKLFGIDFNDAEEQMALRSVHNNLESYETLRKLDVPLDTEPAISFRPYLPGRKPAGKATPGAKVALAAAPMQVQVGPSLEDLAFLPVTALAPLIAARKVSSTDLTRMYLDRLERFGPRLLCVVTLTRDLALAQAGLADREIAAGKYRGPLHGIPWGAKDLFATRGIRTTWGAKPFEQQMLDLDATVVERLRDAGAVLVAKLSMGSLARGGVWFGGSTKTPWNLEQSSSGSSAGSGAATAAGLVGFALGTETLGSIISPSSACGVVGLRPTYGRVSRHGAMSLSWTMDKVGPMCRTVEDCALVLNAIYGPDGHDETAADVPFSWRGDASLKGLRIGFVQNEFEKPPEGASEEARKQWEAQRGVLAAALDRFRAIGVTLEPIELPSFRTNALRVVLNAEAAAAFDDLTRSRGIDQLTAQAPNDWPNAFRSARFIPAVEYIRAQRVRTLLMRQLDALMSRCHVFLSPTFSRSLMMTNLTGHPALAMKCGFADGMPVSLMITGRLYDEETVLRVGLAYERATDWHRKHPTMT
jgi:Asp-tRNA(Asn)/Glu-tRNA(Gln) amidotransferase A subunit family amidase